MAARLNEVPACACTPNRLSTKGKTMEKRLQMLESFKARGDDGNLYTVRGYEHLARLDGVPVLGSDWEPTGVYEYRLVTGEPVLVDRAGAITIAGRGIALHRENSTAALIRSP
jgi:hypothetical protein